MSNITLKQMVPCLQKPGNEILESLTPEKCNLLHHGYGIAGEMIELDLAVKNRDLENFKEEAGDMIFYLEGVFIHIQGMDSLEDIVEGATFTTSLSKSFDYSVESVVDQIKKHVIYNKPLDVTNLYEAVVCSFYQLGCIANTFNLTMKDIIAANKEKLSVRYQGFEYSDKAAQERKDKSNA